MRGAGSGKVMVAATFRRLMMWSVPTKGWGAHHMEAADNPLVARVRRRLGGLARRSGLRRAPQGRKGGEEPAYGPAPEVVLERTNFGRLVDEMVARVRSNQRRSGVNPDYDVLREHFDHYQYMFGATDLHEVPEADPIRIFLRAGAAADTSPDVHFSMEKYLKRYPERAHGPERTPYLEWVKRGRDAGEIADPADGIESLAPLLGLEPGQVVEELVRLRTDMAHRLRTGTLGEMYAKAVELEPLIGGTWGQTVTDTKQLPFRNEQVARAVAGIHSCHQAADFRRARIVIVTNKPRWGGGRRLEGHVAHALGGSIDPAEIVVVYTDEGGAAPPGRFPAGVREIDFFSRFQGVSFGTQQEALVALLRSFCADAILNVNSRLLYFAMRPYGKALAMSERLFLCFFCEEQQPLGNWEGRSLRFFYPSFDYLAGVITDSDHHRDQLIERYQLSDADCRRLHVFRAPAEPELRLTPAPSPPAAHEQARRPMVYWAGRFDRQKRPDIALAIARAMPDVDFRFWGEKVLKGDPLGEVPENVDLAGTYDRFADLDLSRVDAWLYTSAWDGVPSLLMEVGMSGVPAVASVVGGVGELMSTEDGWPVTDWEEPEAYEKALRDVLADPVGARRRAEAMRARLLRERTAEQYADQVTRVLLPDVAPWDAPGEEPR
jgi:glycosyltransferase involved in cell wall biosynthesis